MYTLLMPQRSTSGTVWRTSPARPRACSAALSVWRPSRSTPSPSRSVSPIRFPLLTAHRSPNANASACTSSINHKYPARTLTPSLDTRKRRSYDGCRAGQVRYHVTRPASTSTRQDCSRTADPVSGGSFDSTPKQCFLDAGRSWRGTARSCTGATPPASPRSRRTCGATATAASSGRTLSRQSPPSLRTSRRRRSQHEVASQGASAARIRQTPSSPAMRRNSIASGWINASCTALQTDSSQRVQAHSPTRLHARCLQSIIYCHSVPDWRRRMQWRAQLGPMPALAVRINVFDEHAGFLEPLWHCATCAVCLWTGQTG